MTAWTDERTAEAKRRWLNGESASQIARVLGEGLSRHSIVGKMWRLGVPSPKLRAPSLPRGSGSRSKPPKPAPNPRRPPRDNALARMETRPVFLDGPAVPLLALTPRMCRWPVTGESDSTFFCGAPKPDGRPYCSQHARIAFTPQKTSAAELIRGLRRLA